jgi:hypothetical protein
LPDKKGEEYLKPLNMAGAGEKPPVKENNNVEENK